MKFFYFYLLVLNLYFPNLTSMDNSEHFQMIPLEEPSSELSNDCHNDVPAHSQISLYSTIEKQPKIIEPNLEDAIFNYLDKDRSLNQLRIFIGEKRTKNPGLIKTMEDRIINFLAIKKMGHAGNDIKIFFAIFIGAYNWLEQNLQQIKKEINQEIAIGVFNDTAQMTPIDLAIFLQEYKIAKLLFKFYEQDNENYFTIKAILSLRPV